jgi:hypothetical protein
LEALTEPGASVLLDVFMSWMLERYKGRTYEEILKMLHVLTPLEETRAYQELVNLGRQKPTLELLTKQIHRRPISQPEALLRNKRFRNFV